MSAEREPVVEATPPLHWGEKMTPEAIAQCFPGFDPKHHHIARVIRYMEILSRTENMQLPPVPEDERTFLQSKTQVEARQKAVAREEIHTLEAIDKREGNPPKYYEPRFSAWLPPKDWEQREVLTPEDMKSEPRGITIFSQLIPQNKSI